MNRGNVYIVPREDVILDEMYHETINNDHLSAMKNFSNKYGLCYDFKTEDYNLAPCILAQDGNLIVKTVEDSSMAICYVPGVVTDRQNLWFHTMKDEFLKYTFIGAYLIDKDSNLDDLKTCEDFTSVMKEIDRRNINYGKEGNDLNAFKKI